MDALAGVVRSLGVIAGLLLSSGVVVTSAMAALITYDFAGTVTFVDPSLASQFNPSQRMSGFLTVDSADTDPNPNVGDYNNIQNFQVTIGTYTATMGNFDTSAISTFSGYPFSNSFEGGVNFPNGNVVGTGFDSLSPVGFRFELDGPPGVLTSDALPNPVPSLASFASNHWNLAFGYLSLRGGIENPRVGGTLTSLTVVPLPAAVFLFGGGLVALLGLGARGRWKGCGTDDNYSNHCAEAARLMKAAKFLARLQYLVAMPR